VKAAKPKQTGDRTMEIELKGLITALLAGAFMFLGNTFVRWGIEIESAVRGKIAEYKFARTNLFSDVANLRRGNGGHITQASLNEDHRKRRGHYRHRKVWRKYPPEKVLAPDFDYDRIKQYAYLSDKSDPT
jgi:hypothetical protein